MREQTTNAVENVWKEQMGRFEIWLNTRAATKVLGLKMKEFFLSYMLRGLT